MEIEQIVHGNSKQADCGSFAEKSTLIFWGQLKGSARNASMEHILARLADLCQTCCQQKEMAQQ